MTTKRNQQEIRRKQDLRHEVTTEDGSGRHLVTELIVRRLSDCKDSTKHERLRQAVIACVVEGDLKAGMQLPPEPFLADKTGMSLGTVRRCLTKLAEEGLVTREHGRGTFIANRTQSVNDLWHFRFIAEDGHSLLPVYTRVLSRELVTRSGPWSEALGAVCEGFVRVERAVNVDSRFVCYSDFYLSAESFGPILQASPSQIETVGLKHLIADRFNVVTVRATKRAQCRHVDEHIGGIIGVRTGEAALQVEITAYSYDDLPISYQSIYVPPDAAPMDLWSLPTPSQYKRGQIH